MFYDLDCDIRIAYSMVSVACVLLFYLLLLEAKKNFLFPSKV